jgi:ubiquitin carboxyl-terminal hydrolase 25/28
VEYFSSFYNIVKVMHDSGEAPQELQDLIIAERSRNRYTGEDLQSAARIFGFGADGPLGIEFEPDLDEDFIANAWRDTVKRAWKDSEHGSQLLLEAKEALRVLADARGSVKLRQMWSDAQANTLTPDRAYEMLEVPKEVDEAMLLTVFSFRVGWLSFIYSFLLTLLS